MNMFVKEIKEDEIWINSLSNNPNLSQFANSIVESKIKEFENRYEFTTLVGTKQNDDLIEVDIVLFKRNLISIQFIQVPEKIKKENLKKFNA